MSDTTAKQPFLRELGHRVTDLVARGIIRLAMAMPLHRRVRFFGWVIENVIGPLAGYRRRAETHLAKAFPDMPAAERSRIARQSLNNVGRSLIENYSKEDFLPYMARFQPEGPGFAALKEAHAAGRPVILQSGHFGNYEAVRAALFAHGIEPGGIYREMSNRHFHEHYVMTMLGWGGPGFPRGPKGMRGVIKFLKGGGQLIILNDQHEFGAPVLDFLGHPAHTTLSPAELALRFDAVTIPYFGIRQPDGLSFRCILEEPIAHSDPLTMTQEMNDRLGKRIMDNPEQWFWVPRRWRDTATEMAGQKDD
ncbi:MAG: lauroyl acyltransferase [Pseudomonadota bacterium]